MVCSRWPEPRKTQKNKKKQNCRPHVHRVRQEPQCGLQFCFCFLLFFEVFAWFAPDGQKIENKKIKTADHMSTESNKSPNGVCSFFCFFVFLGFCMVCSRWPKPRKTKQKNCRQHVHRVRQEPQWGLQVFFVFSRFLHGLLQMDSSKRDCLFIL